MPLTRTVAQQNKKRINIYELLQKKLLAPTSRLFFGTVSRRPVSCTFNALSEAIFIHGLVFVNALLLDKSLYSQPPPSRRGGGVVVVVW